MDIKINLNAVNQFSEGTVIFKEGELVFSIALIIKGRVLIHNNGARIIMSPGAFLGINDLYQGKYQSTYTAYDELMIYVFSARKTDDLELILSSNKDYHGYMVASFYKIIYELEQIYQGLIKNGSELHQFLKDTYQLYLSVSSKRGLRNQPKERITSLGFTDNDLELLRDRIGFYMECRSLPIDVVKQFFSYGNAITLYELEDQIAIVNQQMEALRDMAENYLSMVNWLIDSSNSCLFSMFAEIPSKAAASSDDNQELIDIMDSIIEEINKAETFTEKMLGKKIEIDRRRMEEVYHVLLTGAQGNVTKAEAVEKRSQEDIKKALEELKDSFHKLLDYAGINTDRAEAMKAAMLEFAFLKDKFSAEEDARSLRRRITDNFYELYQAVFLKAYQDNEAPRLIELFLKYGFADEMLLTKEQLISLYFIHEEEAEPGLCGVYDIRTWLTMIYEGKKDPSKNEFDMEYPEMLADMKRQGKLTEKEVKLWMTDRDKKLEYEIQNMFRYNNRTTSGKITSFVPVLHKDLLSQNFERLLITPLKVNQAIADIMKIDYSVFDREVLYVNKEKNITKEYVIKRVFPDIVLMPNVGSNGIMWQEISGKRRDSAGRFLLPILNEGELDSLLIRIFGRFRWELCRTIEGPAWNDVTQKSLTSEYCDYLQFYRKNKELSEEKKEKIKLQIQKGRNSSREIFVIDYEQWINYEATGAVKLNKPVREIMATYCPFSRAIRDQLRLQPLFEEAMARYNREKLKKIRELEGRHRLLMKEQIEITQELTDTLTYFKEM